MKNRVVASMIVTLLLLCLVQITLHFAPPVLSDPDASRKEFWQVVTVNNTLPYNTVMDLNVTVNSRNGVYVSCSNNVTTYFQDLAYWQGLGYTTYLDWLNGTNTLVYHWDQMDWYVSNGSLTPISYSDIQYWGDMYLDSGGGVNYTTFMGNTFMADWNLTSPNNNPDIISQAYWQGNRIKMIAGLMVPPYIPNGTINVVFDIVMTQAGSYTFNVTTTPGITVTPSTWTVGGASTILVPNDKPTIHEAVSSANPGDTIVVGTGTYYESQILIDKPLKLLGSGPSTTIIDGQLAAPPTVGLVRIVANTGNVTLSGFTVKNAGKTSGTRVAIYAQSTYSGLTYMISNNVIYGTNNPSDDQDYGLYAYQGNESLVFTNNTITQTGANPILIELHRGPVEISYNTLDAGFGGSDAIFFMTYGGINVATLQNVSYNTFDMGTGVDFDYAHRSTGVSFCSVYPALGSGPEANFTNMVISRNTFNNLKSNRRAIGFWNAGTGSNLASPMITNNTINGVTGSTDSYGIDFYGLTSGATISGNTINGTAVGIYLRSGDAPGTTIRNNNIAGNAIGINWTLGATAVDARYNWWGNETGPHSSTSQYPDSTGDNVTDNVIFGPWLIKPYPPAVPISVVYVDPPFVNLTTPSIGTVFTANVTIANVTSMYGYQFNLTWDSTLLSLTQVFKRIPTVWGNNYLIANESQKVGSYSLAVSARSPAPAFNGTTTVASLVFMSIYDPPYPNNASCLLALGNVTVADPSAKPLRSLVLSSTYSCIAVKAKLLYMASEYVAKRVPLEFEASINVTNVVNLYAFDFVSTFDPFNLTVINVTIPFLAGNPAVIMGWDNNVGYLHVNVTGISPPNGFNGTAVLAKVRFKVALGYVWNTQAPTMGCALAFTSHILVTQSNVTIDHDAIDGKYTYKPLQGDLSMDGLVDVVDLLMVAQRFGASVGDSAYNVIADLNRDGTIDILDIILVARNFGSSIGP